MTVAVVLELKSKMSVDGKAVSRLHRSKIEEDLCFDLVLLIQINVRTWTNWHIVSHFAQK